MPINSTELSECIDEMLLKNKEEVKEIILGNWEWEFIDYYWSPQNSNGDDSKGLSMVFQEDDTVDIIRNGDIAQTATYTITEGGLGSSILKVSATLPEFGGVVSFCEHQMVFTLSDTDGNENYFVKSE